MALDSSSLSSISICWPNVGLSVRMSTATSKILLPFISASRNQQDQDNAPPNAAKPQRAHVARRESVYLPKAASNREISCIANKIRSSKAEAGPAAVDFGGFGLSSLGHVDDEPGVLLQGRAPSPSVQRNDKAVDGCASRSSRLLHSSEALKVSQADFRPASDHWGRMLKLKYVQHRMLKISAQVKQRQLAEKLEKIFKNTIFQRKKARLPVFLVKNISILHFPIKIN